MNENIETLNVNEPIKQPIVNEIDTSNDANDFSDDFFEAKEMDNILDDNWHTDDNVVLNVAPTTLDEKPVVTEETISDTAEPMEKDDFVSLENNGVEEQESNDFDAYFDSLYEDVEGANNLISEIIEKKKNIKENENSINQSKEELAKEKLDFEKYIPNFIINIFKKIFNINKKEVIIFILSIISGYPNNAKMLNNNQNLNVIVNYTSFVNPIFLICTVGIIYLKDIKLALIIYISHILSNIILGILLKNKNKVSMEKDNTSNNSSIFKIYFSSLKSTTSSLVMIFSNILFFSILLSLITNILPFKGIINSLILGIFEFSNGIYLISLSNISIFLKGLFILIIITFSSFSIHMQMISVNEKIKYTKFLLFRILCVFISIIIYLFSYNLFY